MWRSRNRDTSGDGPARARIAIGFLTFGFLLVGANQLRVQVSARDEILASADGVGQLVTERAVPAERGRIYSADGRLLARSAKLFKMGMTPDRVPLSPAFFADLSEATGVSAAELMDFAARGGPGRDWEDLLSRSQRDAVRRIRADYQADGLWTKSAGRREYPMGPLAAPIIGWVTDGRGRTGLEASLESSLAGEKGLVVGVTDRSGRFIPWLTRSILSRPVRNGADVYLTIDSEIQRAAMQSLAAQCELQKADDGVVVVLNPINGDILALATWPDFDPDDPREALLGAAEGLRVVGPELNPAVGLRFEPGSMFKAFTVALGIDTGVIESGETVTCEGRKRITDRVIRCAGDHRLKAHGAVTKELCIEASCNVAAATWAVEIGFNRLAEMIRGLGLLDRPGIGLTGEVEGDLDFDEYNKTLQAANLGFGQSLNATPVALAGAFAVFANDGMLVRPRLIMKIGAEEQPVRFGGRVFRPETARQVLAMMEQVVQGEHGTGRSLRIPGYRLAGKTGTAQKRDPETGRMDSGMYVSSFVGYVPAESPKAVVLVMIDNPSAGQYYGAQVAGPVFDQVCRFLINYWKMPAERASEENVAAR